jgi:antitoxin component YwqK of YwqJK toxin-antitoxin module
MSSECFEKNLELFAQKNSKAALALEAILTSNLLPSPTWAGEPNLFNQSQNFFYHSKQNAAWEAKQWFRGLSLEGIQAIIVIGIGLGYYYDALEEWLSADSMRFAIFLEDDLQVLKAFLETERAAKLLMHPQIIIKYFETPADNGWGKFREEFAWIFWAFATALCAISGLKAYVENRQEFYTKISNQIQINLADKKEFLSYFRKESQEEVFTNFYHNIPYLPEAGFAHTLYEQFRNVPAIICGAGPSLAKHFEQLRGMHDKALIFGAGSALNALTAHGVLPHFAAGVDPTEIQENRLRTNQAFGVPFFYRMRFNAGAFQEIHGPKLYVESGNDPYSTDWFEKQWEIYSSKQIEAGTSTTHFCLKIAEALGCNPIILIGLDLAYTRGQHYAEGVKAHATSGVKERDQIAQLKKEKWISVKGVAEPVVSTTWSWIQEGALYTQFLLDNPHLTVINATEGGMDIWQIPQESLAEVSRKYLQKQENLAGRIQALVINSYRHALNSEQILLTLNKWLESLRECEDQSQKILHLLDVERDEVLFPAKGPLAGQSGMLSLYQAELESELAYREFFTKINEIFNYLSQRDQYLLKARSESEWAKSQQLKKIELVCKRYTYLLTHLEIHRKACQSSIKDFLQRQCQLAQSFAKPNVLQDTGEYWIKEGMLHIEDKSLDLSVHEPFQAEEKVTLNEYFKEVSFYQNGELHGPSRFYDQAGLLLSETWYVKGVKQGKQSSYFAPETPWRILHYKNDCLHGPQWDFYQNSYLKSEVFYQNGWTEGTAVFYFPNGRLKRNVSYRQGKMQGTEKYWDESGNLLLESHYEKGLPCGISRKWYPNGQLARQVTYDERGNVTTLEEWDMQGHVK